MKSNDDGLIESLAVSFLKRSTVTSFIVFVIIIAGVLSYFSLGRLEDPDFTIKTAMVITRYPGATPEEVEKEVTEPLEIAIQQIADVDDIRSTNRAGLSLIKVNMKESSPNKAMIQVWDVLRKKISDASKNLPMGAQSPVVADDFGQVYGHVLSLSSKGHEYKDLEHYAKDIKRKISLVKGVARVELWGEQPKVVYVDLNQARMSSLGISAETVIATLSNQNNVEDVGSITSNKARLRMEVSGAFTSPEHISDLLVRANVSDSKGNALKDTQLRLGDIATITTTTIDPPLTIMRNNGDDAMAISISAAPNINIVELSKRLEEKVEELKEELPIGFELHKIAWQGGLIDASVNDFIINLIESLVIVAIVLTLSMGWRMGVVIGGQLLLTILGTLIVMKLSGIVMHRVSLGALIIAMGMMVDNAIVIAEGIYVKLKKGIDKITAVRDSVGATAWPLLGATAVAVLAFYPIYGNDTNVGEFCASMFAVISISLVFSWFLAILVAPLHTVSMIPVNDSSTETEDSPMLKKYEAFLHWSIKNSKLFILIMLGVLFLSFSCFRFVDKMFFPNSNRPQMVIHYYGQEGIGTKAISEQMKKIEKEIEKYDNVSSYSTFIGQGSPRFYLPVEPESQDQAYGQIVMNLKSSDVVQETYEHFHKFTKEHIDGMVLVKKYSIGPGNTWKFEARFDGPADASPKVLKDLARQGIEILKKSPLVDVYRTDWREMSPKVRIDYHQERGRISHISRDNVIKSLKKSFDGLPVGVYREDDTLYPIILRSDEKDRESLENLDALQVYPNNSSNRVPLDSVVKNMKIAFEDPIIMRYNRHRMITVQANPIDGVSFPTLQQSVIDEFNNIKLPKGYSLSWDGEAKSSKTAQEGLAPAVPPTILVMVLIVVLLFNAYRPTIIIFMTIPFVVIGMVFGLLLFNASFGFVALLGAMSLSGMMIKNGIVLLDEIIVNREAGIDDYDAIIISAKSRLRPVLLAAGTTVLGCIPLIQDLFWQSLAIVIMAGLLVGTIMTMAFVPVLYSMFYGIKRKK